MSVLVMNIPLTVWNFLEEMSLLLLAESVIEDMEEVVVVVVWTKKIDGIQ